jgi:putative colanic acid biosynthesis UDP-glucose lipid carrier transferase
MAKKENSGNSKYYSIGNFPDPRDYLETMDRIDTRAIPQRASRIPKEEAGSFTPLYTRQPNPLSLPFNRMIKRAVDLVVSLVVIILILSWLIPIFALLIKLSSRGPVFFLQKRTKRNGKIFSCIKFRTMVVNPEADIQYARVGDCRITKIGAYMRRHFLDEFPQFLNVLAGDMSVIGPRPHMLFETFKFEKLVINYPVRHCVKPGITGLAQVLGEAHPSGRVQVIRERVRLDSFYVAHWSPILDCRILCKTFLKMSGL